MQDQRAHWDKLIANPLHPNPSAWAMTIGDYLNSVGMLTDEAKNYIRLIRAHNGAFPQYNNALLYSFQSAYKKIFCDIHTPELKKHNQIFVAMPFDSVHEQLFDEVISPVARNLHLEPIKVNSEEFEGSIIERIKSDILNSAYLIADLTNNCNGVYYEAGIAVGLQMCNHPIKIVLTCNNVFFHCQSVHFDLRGDNILLYESTEDYKAKLSSRIKALLKEEE